MSDWVAESSYNDGIWYISTKKNYPHCGDIATVWGMNNDGEKHARLIAAAPDMYEALEAVISSYKDGNFGTSMIRAIEIVIAKANGWTPK